MPHRFSNIQKDRRIVVLSSAHARNLRGEFGIRAATVFIHLR